MHVPLVTAVVRKEVIDYAVEARPVGSVIGVSSLRAGDGDMGVLITLYHCVARYLVGPRESDLHESAMIRPGGEVTALAGFISGEGNHVVPVFEISAPLLVERGQRAILLFQPRAKLGERAGTPIEIDGITV